MYKHFTFYIPCIALRNGICNKIRERQQEKKNSIQNTWGNCFLTSFALGVCLYCKISRLKLEVKVEESSKSIHYTHTHITETLYRK